MSVGRESAVSWRNVSKIFPNGYRGLADVTLEAAQGEILALLGTSGSGKTTMLRLVNRLIDPTGGELLVGGRSTLDWDKIALRRSIGYVIQDAGLFPHLTVEANVGIVPRLEGTKRGIREKRAGELLELVGLEPSRFAKLYPRELSGGQRQRVGVARALAADPALILMDEPFGALDPVTRRTLQDEFRSLQQRLGKTVVIVTHDVREASRLADKIALMDQGMLVQQGTAVDFLQRPVNEFAKAFFDESASVAEIPS